MKMTKKWKKRHKGKIREKSSYIGFFTKKWKMSSSSSSSSFDFLQFGELRRWAWNRHFSFFVKKPLKYKYILKMVKKGGSIYGRRPVPTSVPSNPNWPAPKTDRWRPIWILSLTDKLLPSSMNSWTDNVTPTN